MRNNLVYLAISILCFQMLCCEIYIYWVKPIQYFLLCLLVQFPYISMSKSTISSVVIYYFWRSVRKKNKKKKRVLRVLICVVLVFCLFLSFFCVVVFCLCLPPCLLFLLGVERINLILTLKLPSPLLCLVFCLVSSLVTCIDKLLSCWKRNGSYDEGFPLSRNRRHRARIIRADGSLVQLNCGVLTIFFCTLNLYVSFNLPGFGST